MKNKSASTQLAVLQPQCWPAASPASRPRSSQLLKKHSAAGSKSLLKREPTIVELHPAYHLPTSKGRTSHRWMDSVARIPLSSCALNRLRSSLEGGKHP